MGKQPLYFFLADQFCAALVKAALWSILGLAFFTEAISFFICVWVGRVG